MAFVLRVYASKDFLVKLMSYDLYTIQDFNESNEIDIESYLFFKTILYRKVSRIHVNLSDDLIEQYKQPNHHNSVDPIHQDICKLIFSKRDKTFVCDNGVIDKIKARLEALRSNELPHYLFLGEVSDEICRDVEKKYGIVCFSNRVLRVPDKIRNVGLSILGNTKQRLYDKLNETSFNTIHVNDPYFFKNALAVEKRNEVIGNLLKKDKNYKTDIKVIIVTTLKESGKLEIDFNSWGKQFESELNLQQNNSSLNFSLGNFFDGSSHDRYVFTNKHINIIGNSFFQNSETHFTSYPIGIYHSIFEDKIT